MEAANEYVQATFSSPPKPTSLSISGDPQQAWFGIEWETDCGKNDGSIEGIRYFSCSAHQTHASPTATPERRYPKAKTYYCSMVRRAVFRVQKSLVRAMFNRYSIDLSAGGPTARTKTSGLDPFYRSPEGSFPNVHHCDCTANDSLQCIGFAHAGILLKGHQEGQHHQSPKEGGLLSAPPISKPVAMRHVLSHRSLLGDMSEEGSIGGSGSPLGAGDPMFSAAADSVSQPTTVTATPVCPNSLLTFPPAIGAGCTALPASPINSHTAIPLFDTVFFGKGGSSNFSLPFLFPNLHTLSITGSLLQSWGELWEILISLPSLRDINASNNPLKNLDVDELQERWWYFRDRVRGTDEELVADWRGITHSKNSPLKPTQTSSEAQSQTTTTTTTTRRLPPLTHLNISDTNTSTETMLVLLAVFPTLKIVALGHNPPPILLTSFKKAATGQPSSTPPEVAPPSTSVLSLLHPVRVKEATERIMCSGEDWAYLKHFEQEPGSPAAAPYLPAFSQIVVDAAETLLYSVDTVSVNKLDFSGKRDLERLNKLEGLGAAAGLLAKSLLNDSSLTPLLQSIQIVCKVADRVLSMGAKAKAGGPATTTSIKPDYPRSTSLRHLTISHCPVASLSYERYSSLVDGNEWRELLFLLSQKGLSFSDRSSVDEQEGIAPTDGTLLAAARGIFDHVQSLVARACPNLTDWDLALSGFQRTVKTKSTCEAAVTDAKTHISFPALESLSFSDAPMLAAIVGDSTVTRRAALAVIPQRVTKLNMSDVTVPERTSAERYALRLYGDLYYQKVVQPVLSLITESLKTKESSTLEERKVAATSILGDLSPPKQLVRGAASSHRLNNSSNPVTNPTSPSSSPASPKSPNSPPNLNADSRVGEAVLTLERQAASRAPNPSALPKANGSESNSDEGSSSEASEDPNGNTDSNRNDPEAERDIHSHDTTLNDEGHEVTGHGIIPLVFVRFLRKLLDEAADDLLKYWGSQTEAEATDLSTKESPKKVQPKFMKYAMRAEFTTVLLPATELVAQRCGGFVPDVAQHIQRMDLRSAQRSKNGQVDSVSSAEEVIPVIGEQAKGMDRMFETMVDIRWTVSDLRKHLAAIAHIPEGDPFQLLKGRQLAEGDRLAKLHEVINEEEHWALCKTVFDTTIGYSRNQTSGTATERARAVLQIAKNNAIEAAKANLISSDNPAGYKFPPISSLFPSDSMFLFHVDRDLYANEGAVAKGMHCRELLRGQDSLHGCRVNDGDLFVVVMIV
eukprot:GILI01001427.1.p1 GENE.GILI01001427.1~~GILI01001427.1.p1  ORF type:complete len:1250 (+),score=240.30 GILI01001427.1:112-3861(+)